MVFAEREMERWLRQTSFGKRVFLPKNEANIELMTPEGRDLRDTLWRPLCQTKIVKFFGSQAHHFRLLFCHFCLFKTVGNKKKTADDWIQSAADLWCRNRKNALQKCGTTSTVLVLFPAKSLLTEKYFLLPAVWPVKKSPNCYRSCPKMIALEVWTILTLLQNRFLGDFCTIIVATDFEKLPKVQ